MVSPGFAVSISLLLISSFTSRQRPLWESFDRAIPESLIPGLVKDGRKAETIKASGLKHGKLGTWWTPLNDYSLNAGSRFASEAAVKCLFRLAFPGKTVAESGITGGEWWFQMRGASDDIGFHYDKDEGVASIHMRMEYPEYSTVSYLNDGGAPTIIFDQISPEGNGNIPIVPVRGAFVFPKKGKHLVFHGNIMHGVHGKLEQFNPSKDMYRTTFLVNWWKKQPMPPNTVEITRDIASQFASVSGKSVEPLECGSPSPGNFLVMELDSSSDPLEKYSISFPPKERFHFMLPNKNITQPDNMEVLWSKGLTLGGLNDLDLNNPSTMNIFFRSKEPKCIFFYENVEKMEDAALPVILGYLDNFHFYGANVKSTEDAMRHFGISSTDAPVAVIHDTKGSRKFKMAGSFTENNIQNFLENYLKNNLQREEL